MTTLDRFMRHVLRSDEGCWLWSGARARNGYGQVGHDGQTRSAHRVSYLLHVGPIPDGLTIDHTCHNADATCPGGLTCKHRLCVNPAHLDPKTSGENSRAALRDCCPNGHAYTPENTRIRKDNGRRVCRTCQAAQNEKQRVGYGKPGRPSRAARAELAAKKAGSAA